VVLPGDRRGAAGRRGAVIYTAADQLGSHFRSVRDPARIVGTVVRMVLELRLRRR
jgi:hypothetical protein